MLTYDYPLAVKQEIISSIRPYFGPSYPDPDYANKIRISLEWPREQIHFPSIFITFTEGPVRNVGIGHYEHDFNEQGEPVILRHYMFDGQINFSVLALSPIDRDKVSGGLINLLAFSDVLPEFEGFLDEISDDDYVSLVINTEQITPHGETTAPVPWGNQDEMIFENIYSVPVHGEFYSNPATGELVTIDDVEVWPYRPSEQPHWTP